mgnify:CR=1 FL=1
MWYQKTLTLSAKSRGFHLVTDEILNQLADMPRVNIGLLHLLLQHIPFTLAIRHKRFAQVCASCFALLQTWLSAYPRASPR